MGGADEQQLDLHQQSVVLKVLQYFEELKQVNGLDAESLDIAAQCLSEVTRVNPNDAHLLEKLTVVPQSLPELVQIATDSLRSGVAAPTAGSEMDKFMTTLKNKGFFGSHAPDTPEYAALCEKAQAKWLEREAQKIRFSEPEVADALKEKGNACLSRGDLPEAIKWYTHAINFNESAVYYANRALVYSRLNRFAEAVSDSQRAIQLDPSYTKAHYRLGDALLNSGKHAEAVQAFNEALRLAELANDRSLISSIHERLAEAKSGGSGGSRPQRAAPSQPSAPMGGMPGGFDFGTLLQNPMMQQMAQQLAQDPNMLSSLMQGLGGGNPASASAANNSSAPQQPTNSFSLDNIPGIDELRADPELVPVLNDIETNGPMAAMKYLNNPSVMQKVQALMAKMNTHPAQ